MSAPRGRVVALGVALSVAVGLVLEDRLRVPRPAASSLLVGLAAAALGALAAAGVAAASRAGALGRAAALGLAVGAATAALLSRAPLGWVSLGPFGAGPLGELAFVVLPAAALLASLGAPPWISRGASRTPPSSRRPPR